MLDAARKEIEDLRAAKSKAQQNSLDKSKRLRETTAQLQAATRELDTCREEKKLMIADNDERHRQLVERMDEATQREKARCAEMHYQLMDRDASLAVAVEQRLLLERELAAAREALRDRDAAIAERQDLILELTEKVEELGEPPVFLSDLNVHFETEEEEAAWIVQQSLDRFRDRRRLLDATVAQKDPVRATAHSAASGAARDGGGHSGERGDGGEAWLRVQAQEGVIRDLLRRCSELEARERARADPAEGSAAHEYRLNVVAYQERLGAANTEMYMLRGQLAVAEERARVAQSETQAVRALMETMRVQPVGLEPATLGRQLSERIAGLVRDKHRLEADLAEARGAAARLEAQAAQMRRAAAAEGQVQAETVDGLRTRLEEATREALLQQLRVQDRLRLLERQGL